jgi:hypothetical protein
MHVTVLRNTFTKKKNHVPLDTISLARMADFGRKYNIGKITIRVKKGV